MSAVQSENYVLQSSTHGFSAIWQGSRVTKKAGWIKAASSDGSAKEVSTTQSADKWGGNADPLTDTYNAAIDTVRAWRVDVGPTILKLSFTAAVTLGPGSVNFIPGEPCTQASSGATGEFRGYDYDAVNGAHAVIFPRTGTFDGTHAITGSVSGASFTPTGIDHFVIEHLLWKSTDTVNGISAFQCVSDDNENASRFSVLANSAGCTATVAPGGGGTGNAFPTAGSWMTCGLLPGPTFYQWWGISSNMVHGQFVAANCTPGTGVSADPSFWWSVGDSGAADRMQPYLFMVCDDGEPADLCPFVSYHDCFDAMGTRLSSQTQSFTSGGTVPFTNFGGSGCWRSWRRRGFASGDAFSSLCPLSENDGNSQLLGRNQANPHRIANSYATTPPLLRRPVRLVAQDDTAKMYKGHARWLDLIQSQVAFDVLDSKTRMAINSGTGGSPGTMVCGLFDGSTTTVQ